MSQVETYSQKIARWRNAEASSMRALKNQMPRIYNRIHNADTGSQQLKYPLENEQDYGGYITFTAKQEAPKPLGKWFVRLLTDDQDTLKKFNLDKRSDETTPDLNPDGPNMVAPEATVDAKRDDRPPLPDYIGSGRTCRLYLPQAIQFQDTVTYTNIDLGILGSVAENAVQNNATGAELLRSAWGNIKESFESLGEVMAKGFQTEAAQIAALRLSRRMNTGVAGAISTQTGIALNPNRRSVLQGPNLRNFRFAFKMIPTSPDEAKSIKSIVQFFREELYPEQTNDLGVSAALKYPSQFHIKMKYRTNDGKVKNVASGILPCHLTGVDVVYNPTGMAFHTDGEVQETDLNLQFTEIRTLTKRDVALGGY